jgi:hypothetical protein
VIAFVVTVMTQLTTIKLLLCNLKLNNAAFSTKYIGLWHHSVWRKVELWSTAGFLRLGEENSGMPKTICV